MPDRSPLHDAGHAGPGRRRRAGAAGIVDTREKIVDLSGATAIAASPRSRGVRWKLVSGYFDVLTPGHVRALISAADGAPLMAIILDRPDSLLPSRARAELAASLRMVDYVLLLEKANIEQAIKALQPDQVIAGE